MLGTRRAHPVFALALALAAMTLPLARSASPSTSDAASCVVLDEHPEQVVSGTIRDPANAPVAAATLRVSCGARVVRATTDASGRFSLRLAPGRYDVAIEAPTFAPLRDVVTVEVVSETSLDFQLIAESAVREELTVTGLRAPLPRASRGGTKTSTPLAETPQAITVVPEARIRDTGAQGVQDALNYAAGVRSDAFGLDSRTDSVLVRGSYPDEYVDGMRQLFNYYTSTTRVDPYQLERIEVLRGPSSMLYGQGTTAGIVNLVTKRPLAEEEREVILRFGSFERRQVQADLTGPVTEDGAWLYRVVAVAREADTQVDFVDDDRLLVAPSLTWQPTADTTVTLQLHWQRDRSGSTLQFFPWSGSVTSNRNGDIPTERFIGEPGFDRYDSDRETASWTVEHRLGDAWSLRHGARYVRNEVDYRSLYSDSFSNPGDSYIDAEQRRLGRYAFLANPKVRMWTTDQNVEGTFLTGAIEHRVIAGVDALRFRQESRSAFDFPEELGGGVPSIDVFAPVYTGYTPPALADEPETTQSQLGAYAQNQMKIGRRVIVVAGLRHDRVKSEQAGADTERSRATTGRLGVMLLARGGLSPYASYSESFTPVAGTNVFGDRFDPLKGEQIELGIKFEPASRALSITAAAFELREENRLVSDPGTPLNQIQAGKTETSGVELEVEGRVAPRLEVSAHYNYLDNDDQLDGVPPHQAAVWATRQFSLAGLGGFAAGLGVRGFDAFRDGSAPRTPSVTLVDAMLAYETATWSVTINASNLADERYVSTCLPRGDCFFGARRTVSVALGYDF